jgi:hypothetical protein
VDIIIGYAVMPLLSHGYYICMDDTLINGHASELIASHGQLRVIRCTPTGDIHRYIVNGITPEMLKSLTRTSSTETSQGLTCNMALLQHLRTAYALQLPPGYMEVAPAAPPTTASGSIAVNTSAPAPPRRFTRNVPTKAEQRLQLRRQQMGDITDAYNRSIVVAPHEWVLQHDTRAQWGVTDLYNESCAHWSDPNQYWCKTRTAIVPKDTDADDDTKKTTSAPTATVAAKPLATFSGPTPPPITSQEDLIKRRYFLACEMSPNGSYGYENSHRQWTKADNDGQLARQQSMLSSLVDIRQWPFTLAW